MASLAEETVEQEEAEEVAKAAGAEDGAAAAAATEQEEDEEEDDSPGPRAVFYCRVSGYPLEFIDYSPFYKDCVEWIQMNGEKLLESDIELDDSALDVVLRVQAEAAADDGSGAKELTPAQIKQERKRQKALRKKLAAQGKASGADRANAMVLVTKCKRGKRKCVSNIRGLELFGISLKDAAKALGKRFACGASIVKEEEAGIKFKQIVVQGDVEYDIKDVLLVGSCVNVSVQKSKGKGGTAKTNATMLSSPLLPPGKVQDPTQEGQVPRGRGEEKGEEEGTRCWCRRQGKGSILGRLDLTNFSVVRSLISSDQPAARKRGQTRRPRVRRRGLYPCCRPPELVPCAAGLAKLVGRLLAVDALALAVDLAESVRVFPVGTPPVDLLRPCALVHLAELPALGVDEIVLARGLGDLPRLVLAKDVLVQVVGHRLSARAKAGAPLL